MGLVTWADFYHRQRGCFQHGIRGSYGIASYASPEIPFIGNHHNINVSPGCQKRCLKDPLMAVRPFLYLQGEEKQSFATLKMPF